jgi:PAS domain S-box-containing protein
MIKYHHSPTIIKSTGYDGVTGETIKRTPQEFRKWFELLSRTFDELNNFPHGGDLYRFMGETLRHFVPESTIILVSAFDQDAKTVTLHAVEGLGPRQPEIEKILCRPLNGLTLPVPDQVLPEMINGECIEITGGLTDLSFGLLPQETCRKIETKPYFGKVYGAGISWKGRLEGAALFILPAGTGLENHDQITFFIRQVAGFLSRREAEEALKESEEKFSAAFRSSAALMAISTKHDGKLIDVNDTFLDTLGYSRYEVIGKKATELGIYQQPSDRSHALHVLEERGKVRNLEVPVRTKDGSVQYGLFGMDNIMIGAVPCLLTTMVDITEQKILEREMEFHAQEVMQFSRSLDMAIRKLNLLSSITRHDINNQLTVLMGYLEILGMKQPDTSNDEYFRKAATVAQRISTMIQFTRTYESIGAMAPAWQDIRTLADAAATEAPLGKVILKNDLPAGAEIYADPLIVKVFYNLMDNAVRYGGRISTIRFSSGGRDGDRVIVCEDDGYGIPADEKEMIFERGYGKNTGLGLFLTREILGITGITVRETGEPGTGARFEITVPEDAYRITGQIPESAP